MEQNKCAHLKLSLLPAWVLTAADKVSLFFVISALCRAVPFSHKASLYWKLDSGMVGAPPGSSGRRFLQSLSLFFHLSWHPSLRPSLAPTCSSRRWRIKFSPLLGLSFSSVSLYLTPPKFEGLIISPLTLILVVPVWCFSCKISLVVKAKASISILI